MSRTTTMYCPGPAQCFVGTGASGAFEFLGFSERGFDVMIRPSFRQIDTDFSGDVGADQLYTGQSGGVRGTLTWYNEAIVQKLAHWLASAASISGGQLLGSDPAGTSNAVGLGTLMNLEGASVGLVIQSGFAARANNSAFGMIPGAYFYSVIHEGDLVIPHSLDARRIPVNFKAIPVFNPTAGTGQLWTPTLPTGLVVT